MTAARLIISEAPSSGGYNYLVFIADITDVDRKVQHLIVKSDVL